MNHYTMHFTSPPPPDDAPLLEWALWYASQGWPVFPCYGKQPLGLAVKHGFHDATCDDTTIRHWWGQWPAANIGVPVQAGEVVLDIDPRKGGDTTLHALQHEHSQLPDTLISLTGGDGQHLKFTITIAVKNKANIGDGIDVQGPGSYVIVPPSIHPETGRRYLWDAAYGPESMTPQPAPSWLEALISHQDTAEGTEAVARDPQAPILEGTRETTLMALAGAMQRLGASPDAIRSALEAENQRCVPPLSAADLDRMTRSVGRYAPAPRLEVSAPSMSRPAGSQSMPPQDIPLADYFNARALVETHGADMRYCRAWRDWLVWSATHWRRDDLGQVMQWAKGTLMALLDTLKDIADTKARDAFYRHIRASLNTSRLEALVKSADNEPGIRVTPEQFDQYIWLLNCTNGTLDLRTGLLQPHRREELLTKCLTMAYDPEATCPVWERFLWRAMGGSLGAEDPDASAAVHQSRYEADERARRLIGFIQRAVGYSLTGSTREQCLFLLHGVTKTGKSTCVSTLRSLLGPYGKQAEMNTFLLKDRPEIRNDLADLAGSRLVVASESDKGKRLAENLIKQLTGGTDLLKARFLFQDLFEFPPQFKLFLATNHLPVIRDNDDAIWERIYRIQFDVFIPPGERDKTLEDTLQRELPGILAWAVRGCLEWQRYGDLRPPPEVRHATEAYRHEMDTLPQFLEECCLFSPAFRVRSSVLYKAYQQWCLNTGQAADSMTGIGKRIEKFAGVTKKQSNGIWYIGLGLSSSNDDE